MKRASIIHGLALSLGWSLLAATLLGAMTLSAQAGEQRDQTAAPPLPAYQQECGACHLAYPARLLPAASWQALLADLPHHFGSDASLDPATTAQLSAWLARNAASGRKAADPVPDQRITRAPWFVRKHDELAPSVWRRPAIKSAANCGACHTHAQQGEFHESAIRIPR